MISLNSKITQSVLGYLLLHDNESLYTGEIVRRFNLDKRNTVKKLRELEEAGLLVSTRKGKEVYYSLNKEYPLLSEIKKIVLKTWGIEHQLRNIFQDIGGIKEAYIFGSYAENKMDASSDIDVLVVGQVDSIELNRKMAAIQKNTTREINVINITPKELLRKKKVRDPFIEKVFRSKRIKLI